MADPIQVAKVFGELTAPAPPRNYLKDFEAFKAHVTTGITDLNAIGEHCKEKRAS